MAAGDATAADVPGKYDVVINGKGYVFADSVESSLPFRTHRAIYDITPTFVQRQNMSNAYGDNAQDFFLTVRQRDWSNGEQQKYYRAGQDGRYWMGSNIDRSIPGQVTLARAVNSVSFAGAVSSMATYNITDVQAASATNLYQINAAGTITDLGAHGLGAAPSRYGMTASSQKTFLTTAAAGTVGVRAHITGGAYSTFSATPADSIAVLNNTLYGLNRDASNARLLRYDSAGTATSVYDWKDPVGSALTFLSGRIEPFGGKLLILFAAGGETNTAELWIYDGTAPSKLEVFPANFIATEMEVLYGVAYISGVFTRTASSTTSSLQPAVLFFDGSQIGILWKANGYSTTTYTTTNVLTAGPWPALAVFDGNLVWNDDYTAQFLRYDPSTGGVSSFGSYTVAGDTPLLHGAIATLLHTRNQTTTYQYPSATYASSGYVISSLIDFDSSLKKQFRGVTVYFDAASDGDGGSVDVAYQVDSVSGSWTTLQSGVTSGTEVTFSGISGNAVAIKITLNKGTSTAGPTLKSMNLRASPVLKQFRSGTYVIDCTGTAEAPRQLRDGGTMHPLVGYDQMTNLFTVARSTAPFSVTDRVGTFTALVDLNDQEGFDVYEIHPAQANPSKSGSYMVRIKLREV